jgi:hypothetical protein
LNGIPIESKFELHSYRVKREIGSGSRTIGASRSRKEWEMVEKKETGNRRKDVGSGGSETREERRIRSGDEMDVYVPDIRMAPKPNRHQHIVCSPPAPYPSHHASHSPRARPFPPARTSPLPSLKSRTRSRPALTVTDLSRVSILADHTLGTEARG